MRRRVEAFVKTELKVDLLDGTAKGEPRTVLRGPGPGDQRCPVKSFAGELMRQLIAVNPGMSRDPTEENDGWL